MLDTEIYVVTAPSGTGKTTLNRRIISELSTIEISISTTTRQRRPNEDNGVHYWFVSESEFKKMVEQGLLLEWANVHGHLYGTTRGEIERIRNKNLKILLEIDVQGWHQLKKTLRELVSIFLMPPSLESLWERLALRGTDSLATRFQRIKNAQEELKSGLNYQHFIVNDDIEKAFSQLKSIVEGRPDLSLDQANGRKHCQQLLDAFDRPWLKNIEEQLRQKS